MFDVIIIGAGASGLFCGMLLPKNTKKLILEKTATIGNKVLLSGKGRCNFTNRITDKTHYLGDCLERLDQFFEKFGPEQMITFLEDHGIESKEEENGRILLKSNKSCQLVDFLIEKNQANETVIQMENEVLDIKQKADGFLIHTTKGDYHTKKVILASGGCSFPQIGASDFAFSLANSYCLRTKNPQPALCGITVQEQLNALSGSSTGAKVQIIDKGKVVYERSGNVLFTHRGISGPVIFNTSLWIGYHYENKAKNLKIRLTIPTDQMTKRLFTYLKAPKGLGNYIMTLSFSALRSRNEAKAMSGGILLDEVNNTFELKKVPGMFLLGEALNITGETGGFNLQRCRTSAFCCGNNIK